MIGSRHRLLAAFSLLTVLTVGLAACGSDSEKTGASGSGPSGASAFTGTVPEGGTITIGAEQEPQCFDWIGQCSGSQWGTWIAQIHTQPWAYVDAPTADGALETIPSPLLTGEAVMQPTPVQTITYKIAPEAVWSDGVQITCDDFAYVVDQQQNGKQLYDPTGYTDIDTVDCSDPKTVVVKYKDGTSFANWKALFSSGVGVMPAHLLQGKDRTAAMQNGYEWSGGPWFAKWSKGKDITLTPNPKYWGQKPHLDKVVFKFTPNTAAQFQAFKQNLVQAIYPQPQLDVVDAINAGLPDAKTQVNAKTGGVEGVWFNHDKPPFDSLAVRQAFGYAIDRDAIVEKLFGDLGVTEAANSINPYVLAEYSDQEAWANYVLDLDKVDEIMTDDGWEKDDEGVWAKGDQRAEFEINTTAGDKRRELTEEIMQPMLAEAGFKMTIQNKTPDDLFGTILYEGTYQAAIYSSELLSLTPGLCSIMCTENIPSEENDFSGNNTGWVSIPEADKLMRTVDTSLDDDLRKENAAEADRILAEHDVALPLDPLPHVLIWSDKVVGPITDNAILGMFWNLNEWGVQQ